MGETQNNQSTELLHPPGAQQLISSLNDRALEEMSKSFAFATRLDDLVAWGAKNALWPLPYGTACCGIELMSVMGPKYDLARFGAEVVRFSPRQADLLLVAGTITEKMVPVLVHIYEQMLDPKYVISMGACASSGGFYRSYHRQGVMTLQRMIAEHTPRPWRDNWKRPSFLKPIE